MFEIRQGQTVKCLHCGKDILLDAKTFILDCEAEYIVCPNCGAKDDVQEYHAKGISVQEENVGEIERCTITIFAPEVDCPYKVGDKFITAMPDFDKPRFCVENFLKVVELTVSEVDLSNKKFPRLYCRDSNQKPVAVAYRFAPHFATLEEAEREIAVHNQRLQKKIDEYIAKYGQDEFEKIPTPLKRPFGDI